MPAVQNDALQRPGDGLVAAGACTVAGQHGNVLLGLSLEVDRHPVRRVKHLQRTLGKSQQHRIQVTLRHRSFGELVERKQRELIEILRPPPQRARVGGVERPGQFDVRVTVAGGETDVSHEFGLQHHRRGRRTEQELIAGLQPHDAAGARLDAEQPALTPQEGAIGAAEVLVHQSFAARADLTVMTGNVGIVQNNVVSRPSPDANRSLAKVPGRGTGVGATRRNPDQALVLPELKRAKAYSIEPWPRPYALFDRVTRHWFR